MPIARTGWYEYSGKELGVKGRENELIKVYRSPSEVFSKKAIASFNGKIVTDNHPPDLLTPENAQRYSKGAIQNVRQSKEETDLLLADLIIYDKRLIEEIQDGKREVSCGYEYVCIDNGDGTFSQTEICGNHVAVVDAGRAGSRVAIKDSKSEVEEKVMSRKVRISNKNSTASKFLLALGLKHFSMDAEPEEIEAIVDEMAEENKEKKIPDDVKEEKKPSEPAKDSEVNPKIDALEQKVDKLTALIEQIMKPEEKAPEDAIDDAIKELETGDDEEVIEGADEELPAAEVTDVEDRPKNPIPGADSAAMITALKLMKPIIASIPDKSARKKACDSLITEFKKATQTKNNNKTSYADLLRAQKKSTVDGKAKQSLDEKQKAIENLGDDIAKRYNANLKGGK